MKNQPGKAAACLAVLKEGPSTTGEVAAEVGISSKLAGTHLANQQKLGKCERVPYSAEKDKLGRQRAWLWKLAA